MYVMPETLLRIVTRLSYVCKYIHNLYICGDVASSVLRDVRFLAYSVCWLKPANRIDHLINHARELLQRNNLPWRRLPSRVHFRSHALQS